MFPFGQRLMDYNIGLCLTHCLHAVQHMKMVELTSVPNCLWPLISATVIVALLPSKSYDLKTYYP